MLRDATMRQGLLAGAGGLLPDVWTFVSLVTLVVPSGLVVVWVVFGQLAPLLLQLAADLVPLTLEGLCVHHGVNLSEI
jgi:hypothetical protein